MADAATLALTDSHIMVGDSTNEAADVAMSGDVTIDDTGATTIKSSVALAGSPTTTTQTAGDNSTKIATTAYVDNLVSSGLSVTITTAALTALGSQGSMTFTNGILTAQTQAT